MPPKNPPSILSRSHIESLKDSIPEKPPFCSGSLPVSPEDLLLFYGKDAVARRLDFTKATDADVRHLSETCDVASFGVNHEDVVDETYRKAGKLDSEFFAVKFSLENSGLFQIIRDSLLEGSQAKLPVRAEPYKINVYGKDSFFKPHKDTPRTNEQFGSVVIIYPTAHTGGSLIFRDNGEEWTFDSAAAVSNQSTPCIGYAAFFSDVEHEVTTVTSGYRVTMTYNLYFESTEPSAGPAPSITLVTWTKPKEVLEKILADPTFLPNGGLLGFGLRRQYPLADQDRDPLKSVQLKGSDAILMQTCRNLSLNASLMLLYEEDSSYDMYAVLLSKPPLEINGLEEDFLYVLYDWYGGVRVDPVELDDLPEEGPYRHLLYRKKRPQNSEAASKRGYYYGEQDIEVADGIEQPELDENGDEIAPVKGNKYGTKYVFDKKGYQKEHLADKPQQPRQAIYWVTKPTRHTLHRFDFTAYGNEAVADVAYGDVCLIVKIGAYGSRDVVPERPSKDGSDGFQHRSGDEEEEEENIPMGRDEEDVDGNEDEYEEEEIVRP